MPPVSMINRRFSPFSEKDANANAVGLNGWYNDYIRAECRDATVILDRRSLEYFPYDPAGKWATAVHGEGKAIPLRQQSKY